MSNQHLGRLRRGALIALVVAVALTGCDTTQVSDTEEAVVLEVPTLAKDNQLSNTYIGVETYTQVNGPIESGWNGGQCEVNPLGGAVTYDMLFNGSTKNERLLKVAQAIVAGESLYVDISNYSAAFGTTGGLWYNGIFRTGTGSMKVSLTGSATFARAYKIQTDNYGVRHVRGGSEFYASYSGPNCGSAVKISGTLDDHDSSCTWYGYHNGDEESLTPATNYMDLTDTGLSCFAQGDNFRIRFVAQFGELGLYTASQGCVGICAGQSIFDVETLNYPIFQRTNSSATPLNAKVFNQSFYDGQSFATWESSITITADEPIFVWRACTPSTTFTKVNAVASTSVSYSDFCYNHGPTVVTSSGARKFIRFVLVRS